MANKVRTNHQLRLEAFDQLQKLKKDNFLRKEIIDLIHSKYGIPVGTLYDWYRADFTPYGRRGVIIYRPELLYVLGALLGDGCVYLWKTTNNYLILVGDKKFTQKYARMLSLCINKSATAYIDRSKNIWFVRCNNFELFSLFEDVRKNNKLLEKIISSMGKEAALLFVEGFFDAEGCVKIIKEKGRKTAKICLDIANTNRGYLELIRQIFLDHLHIKARYSVQKSDPIHNRKTCFHLRIYKKDFVRTFFKNISTTKLRTKHHRVVDQWFSL